MKTTLLIIALAVVLPAALGAGGPTSEDRGLAVAEEADRRDLGWGDNQSRLQMVLRNRNGDESRRELRRHALENDEEGAGDKSLVIFDGPRDVKGTALLSHTRIVEPDDQWLFLPALKRVKRISSANKSGPFVGSEFAYEDLLSQEVDKYEYRFVGEETVEGQPAWIVERFPRYPNSGYTKQIVWWDQQEYRILRIDFYDRKEELLKTLVYSGYERYQERYWRADRLVMTNHQTGKSTDLVIDEWEFGTGLKEGDFTPSRLKRAR